MTSPSPYLPHQVDMGYSDYVPLREDGLMLRCFVFSLTLALPLLAGRADDPPKQPPASGLALSNQGLQQKQTQAESQRLAARLDGMLRVLTYHQLDATAEQKVMDEAAGALKGLSREQMKDILQRLDQASRSPTPVETD